MRFLKAVFATVAVAVLSAYPITAAAILPAPEDVADPPESASRTPSGLLSRVLVEGTGNARPSSKALVTVHYTGWTTDGKMIDSSVHKEQPVTVSLDRVLAGWREGLQLMVVGEKRRLWIPQELAYRGAQNKPAGTLVFDVELFGIEEPPKPPPVPEDVASPPMDAVFTKSRLASKVLEEGTGTEHPTKKSLVTVHYTGWTTDGRRFDSSITRGKPSTFKLNQVIPGWTEGVQLMVKGETRRFWIPQKLAYKGQAGAPKGMLVFDVTLLDFK